MIDNKTQQDISYKPGFFHGYIMVAISFLIMFTTWGTFATFGLFFKPLLSAFNSTSTIISGASSVCMLCYGTLGIIMGILNDKLGPRVVLTVCGLLIGGGYLLISQTVEVWQLYLGYAIVGTGMGGCWVPILSSIARWFAKRRSLMTGIVLTGTALGQIFCSPVISRLITFYDWRLTYIIMGGTILLVVVLSAQFLQRDPARRGQFPYGEVERKRDNLKVEAEGYSLKEATHTVQFWIMMVVVFCYGFIANVIVVHIVPYAENLGISKITSAYILSIIGGIGIFGSNILGSLGDKIGNKWIYIIGFIAASAILFWLMSIKELWMLFLFAVIFGFASAGLATIESPLIAWLFGLRWHGLIFGVIHAAWTIGAASGAVIAGYIFDLTGNYPTGFLLCGVIGVVGIIASAVLKPTKYSKTT